MREEGENATAAALPAFPAKHGTVASGEGRIQRIGTRLGVADYLFLIFLAGQLPEQARRMGGVYYESEERQKNH